MFERQKLETHPVINSKDVSLQYKDNPGRDHMTFVDAIDSFLSN